MSRSAVLVGAVVLSAFSALQSTAAATIQESVVVRCLQDRIHTARAADVSYALHAGDPVLAPLGEEATAEDLLGRVRELLGASQENESAALGRMRVDHSELLGVHRSWRSDSEDHGRAAYACGSWTRKGETLLYAVLLAPAKDERDTRAYWRRAHELAGHYVMQLRWRRMTRPYLFSRRTPFTLTPKAKPPIRAINAHPLTGSADDRLPLYAVNPSPGHSVADVGCGNGRHAAWMAEIVGPEGQVFGRDLSRTAIADARERRTPANCSFEVSAPGDVRIPARTLDRAYLCQVWGIVQHQPTRGDLLASVRAALVPEGELIIVQYAHRTRDVKPMLAGLLDDLEAAKFELGRRWRIWDRDPRRETITLVVEARRPAVR